MTPQLQQFISSQPGMSGFFNTSNAQNFATTTPPPASSGGGAAALGTLDYNPDANRNYSIGNLPEVTDPNKAFADVTRGQHEYLIREFRPFEQSLVGSIDDTSLVDAVPEDVREQSRIAREIDERNRSRYGYDRTAVEQREVGREAQRAETTGLAGGLNDARLAQRNRNQSLRASLVNIGQGINREALGQMSSAASMETQRNNAYRADRAAAKAQRWGFLGQL